ncbi:MAG: ATP-dependent helicase, partial [Phascolarctobacterium sp.]
MGKISINTQLKQKGLKLNRDQLEAVKQLKDVSVVTAGGGCGKTNLLIAKINFASLQDPGCSILAITFTKKAVAELQSRIVGNLNCMVNTFHSFFYRILRANGYKSFKFMENDNQKCTIMRKVIEAEQLTDKLTVEMLEEALRKGIFADEDTKKAIDAYFDQLKSLRVLCFDSLQYFCKDLLQNNPAVAIRTRSLFNYVMVDEAQDISKIQLEIIKLIWPANHINNLTFVGDQKQAIYSFRGSAPNVMDELQQYYEAYTFKLTTNYRSTEAILACANVVFPSSEALTAVRGKGEPVVFHAAETQKHEAEYVANQIKLLHNGGTPLRDIVVLFRASHSVRELYEVLVREHIPFVQLGSDPFKWNNSRYKCFL